MTKQTTIVVIGVLRVNSFLDQEQHPNFYGLLLIATMFCCGYYLLIKINNLQRAGMAG